MRAILEQFAKASEVGVLQEKLPFLVLINGWEGFYSLHP